MARFLPLLPRGNGIHRREEAVFGFALLLILFAMAAMGITLTGIGGSVADVAVVVFIVTLSLAAVALMLARRDASDAGESLPPETVPPSWYVTRPRARYQIEDDASGSVVALKERRRL
jgi:hypothetical protein